VAGRTSIATGCSPGCIPVTVTVESATPGALVSKVTIWLAMLSPNAV